MSSVFAQGAQDFHLLGVLGCVVVALLVASMFFYGAYTTLRKGFKVSASKTVEGTPAKIFAGVLVLIGLAIVLLGIFWLPGYAFG